jgi:hypothetical protein
MIAVHSGSYGFQLGGSETDLVLVEMNPSGIRRLASLTLNSMNLDHL